MCVCLCVLCTCVCYHVYTLCMYLCVNVREDESLHMRVCVWFCLCVCVCSGAEQDPNGNYVLKCENVCLRLSRVPDKECYHFLISRVGEFRIPFTWHQAPGEEPQQLDQSAFQSRSID